MESHFPNQTEGKCFICLQKLVQTESGAGESYPASFLGLLTHYVDLKEKKHFTGVPSNRSKLCSECTSLLRKFNRIHDDFEKMRWRLTLCVQELVALMKEADEDVRSSQFGPEHFPSVDPLRQSLMTKCMEKVGLRPPLGTLTPVQVQHSPPLPPAPPTVKIEPPEWPEAEEADQEESLNEDPLSILPELPEDVEITIKSEAALQEDAEDTTEDSEPLPLAFPQSSRSRKQKLQARPDPDVPDFITCSYCELSVQKSRIDQHYMQAHREHYLLDFREDTVTPANFKGVVDRFLFPVLLKTLKCPVCLLSWPRATAQNAITSLTCHLIVDHIAFLGEKVVEFQRDQVIMRKIGWGTGKNRVVTPRKRPAAWIEKESSSNATKKKAIPDTDRNSFPKTTLEVPQDISSVDTIISDIEFSTVELVKTEPEEIPPTPNVTSQNSTPKSTPTTSDKVKCGNCGKMLAAKSVDCHNKYGCAGTGKIRQMCNGCKKYMHPDSLSKHKSYGLCKGIGPQRLCDVKPKAFACDKCGKKSFENSYNLSYHQKNHCQANHVVRKTCPKCNKSMHPLSLKQHLSNASSSCRGAADFNLIMGI